MRATAILIAMLCLSCAQPTRGAIIAIDSDLCEPGDGSMLDFTQVEVTVSRADGTGTPVTICATFDPTDGSDCEIVTTDELPLLLPVQSSSGEGTLNLTATLRDAAGPVACAQGSLTMDPARVAWGYLVVRRPCASGGCETDSVEAMDWSSTGDLPPAITCVPALEQPALPIARIATGDAHACLIDADASLFCWGDNDYGQLGLGADRMDRSRPTRVQLGAGRLARDVAAGRRHTCVLEDNAGSQSVRCFGDNDQGQLGNGMVGAPSGHPVVAGGTTGARQLALGPQHSCARMSGGNVLCWGSNAAGESTGTAGGPVAAPTGVPGVADVTSIGAGGRNGEPGSRHTCVTHSTGGASCWGSDSHGQLGRSTSGPLPEAVEGLAGVVQISPGGEETCASTSDGGLHCWGRNEDPGTLGIPLSGPGTTVAAPTRIMTMVLVDAPLPSPVPERLTLSSSELWRCFVGDGVYCLGRDLDGRLGGAGGATSTPTRVPVPGVTFAQVDVGAAFACALPADGSLPYCWGNDGQGQLGDGPGGTGTPTQIPSCE